MGAVLALRPEFNKYTITIPTDWELLAEKYVHKLYHNDGKAVKAWIGCMKLFEVTVEELTTGVFESKRGYGYERNTTFLTTVYNRFKRPYNLNNNYHGNHCTEDAFSFMDRKYRTTLNILKHKKIRNITTSSDMIACDEYLTLIPKNCKVKLIFKDDLDAPSFKRLEKAKEKLEVHGISVDLVCQK